MKYILYVVLFIFITQKYSYCQTNNINPFVENIKCKFENKIYDNDFAIILYGNINCRVCFDQLDEYFKKNQDSLKKKIYVLILEKEITSLEKRLIINSLNYELLPNTKFETLFTPFNDCDFSTITNKEYPAIILHSDKKNELLIYNYKYLFDKSELTMPPGFIK